MINIAKLLTEHIDIWTAAESEKKSGRGRVSGNAGSVYGVKKLRELILELAVRGKLVPQDPNDEPASELLKSIFNIRDSLIKNEGLKTLANEVINQQEVYIQTPNSWTYCRLGNLAKFIDYRGKTPNKVTSGIPLITAKNVRQGYISREPEEYVTSEEYETWMTRGLPRVGDMLFTTEAPLGNIAIIDISEKFALAQRVICFQLHNQSVGNYIKIALMSNQVQQQLENAATGMTATGIKASNLKEIPIPIPPLAEQRRIVAKVDELMALCDQIEQQHSNAQEAHEVLVSQLLATLTQSQNATEFNANWQRIYAHFDVLFTTEASIDALKQTLLQLAVMGKLVPQDPNDEPASDLLKRIKTEKAKLIAEGKLKKEKPLPAIADDEKPFQLPNGWEWTTLLNVAVVNPRNNAPDDIEASFVPMTYIGSEFSDKHQDEKRLWKDIKQGFTHFAEGDIGVAKITPCFENSKACVFENLENGLGAGTTELHIVRPVGNTLNPRYVLAYLKSPRFLELGESKMTGTAGQKRLPKDFVELNPFPLPPLAEQNRIVAKVIALMALCDQLKIRINQANQLQQKLANALVAQAMA